MEDSLGRALGEDDFHLDFLFNVCNINDPEHDTELRDHWGEHCLTMNGILRSPNLDDLIREVKRYVKPTAALFNSGRRVSVAFLCRSGKHRSVALAKFFRRQWRRDRLGNSQVVHVSELLGYWPNDFCTSCNYCDNSRESWQTFLRDEFAQRFRAVPT